MHFIGLVNVLNLKAGGLGNLGAEQLDWLEKDVQATEEQHADRGLRAHSAVVGLSAMGLGHGRQRAGAGVSEALRIGHGAERPHSPDDAEGRRERHLSHGVLDRVSAAAPGTARHSPGPMKVPADQLRSLLGITDVNFVRGQHTLAIIDSQLQG